MYFEDVECIVVDVDECVYVVVVFVIIDEERGIEELVVVFEVCGFDCGSKSVLEVLVCGELFVFVGVCVDCVVVCLIGVILWISSGKLCCGECVWLFVEEDVCVVCL